MYGSELDWIMQVKIVRDSMNRMLEVWKDIPAIDVTGVDASITKPQANSSRRGDDLWLCFSTIFLILAIDMESSGVMFR